jgi:protein TonB
VRWPFALSLALHGGALVVLGVTYGRAEREPARVAALVCTQVAGQDASPEVTRLPEVPELPPAEAVIEPEPFPEEAEPVDLSEFGVEDPPPEPPPLLRRVRIPPLPRRPRAEPPPAPPPAAASSRVISAVPKGDRCRPPEYPLAARRAKVEGRVLLRVVVGSDGSVVSVEVEESSGSVVLDEAAADAVRAWAFEPAREDGRAVESVLLVPCRFSLRA